MNTRAEIPSAPEQWLVALKVFLSFLFFCFGLAKLMRVEAMMDAFSILAIGDWFRLFSIGCDWTAALAILTPRTSAFGAFLMASIAIGAVMTQLILVKGPITFPLILLSLSIAVIWKEF